MAGTALIVGGLWGITERLAGRLHAAGWQVHFPHDIPLEDHDIARQRFADLFTELVAIDLVIIGLSEPEVPGTAWQVDADGDCEGARIFMAAASRALQHFVRHGAGPSHLLHIARVSGPAFQAEWQSTYLKGAAAVAKGSPITISFAEIDAAAPDAAVTRLVAAIERPANAARQGLIGALSRRRQPG